MTSIVFTLKHADSLSPNHNVLTGTYDLLSPQSIRLTKGIIASIPSGLMIDIPAGHVGILTPCKWLTSKGVVMGAGLIHHGYKGEIDLQFSYTGHGDCEIHYGERVLQLAVIKQPQCETVIKDFRGDVITINRLKVPPVRTAIFPRGVQARLDVVESAPDMGNFVNVPAWFDTSGMAAPPAGTVHPCQNSVEIICHYRKGIETIINELWGRPTLGAEVAERALLSGVIEDLKQLLENEPKGDQS